MIILEYRLISKKGEGTFSEVLQAQQIKTNKQVAIKCMKANFYNIEKVSQNLLNRSKQQIVTNIKITIIYGFKTIRRFMTFC